MDNSLKMIYMLKILMLFKFSSLSSNGLIEIYQLKI